MKVLRSVCALGICAGFFANCGVSQGSFHLWVIKEIFSNHDGSVQFVELFTTAPNETALTGHSLVATSDGVVKTFTLDHAVTGSTANKHLLFATVGFGSLTGGVAPDYFPLPNNFINPDAATISIDWAHGFDIATFAGSLLPKDGVNSLTDSNLIFSGADVFVAGVNSPTNFAGAAGSVNVPPLGGDPADLNGDGKVDGEDLADWRAAFALTNDGDIDGDSNSDGDDFLIWQRQLDQPQAVANASTVAEPTSGLLTAIFLAFAAAFRRGRAA